MTIAPIGFMGSSPLTRGKPYSRVASVVIGGLIPAHAGKALCACRSGPRLPAHPRSRGENMNADGTVTGIRGSSPLMRGKVFARPFATMPVGLIPAHAGKTP